MHIITDIPTTDTTMVDVGIEILLMLFLLLLLQ